jgi:hypothetical protein
MPDDLLKNATPQILEQMYDVEFENCTKDFWYFAQFLITEDEERGIQRPFPLKFPHIHRAHDIAQKEDRLVLLKPRRMQMSMYFCARMLWRAMFNRPPNVYYGGYSAMDETLALYQLYRIGKMYDDLPQWIRNRVPRLRNNALLKEFGGGGKIQGFPLKRLGEQGFGFTEYLFDEAAWQEAAGQTYAGLIFSIGRGKIFIVSTPNGDEGIGEFFHNVWHNKNNGYESYYRLELDSKENPEHDGQWHDERLKECGSRAVYAQMIEKSFEVPQGEPIFPEFHPIYMVAEERMKIVEGKPVYVCWDFGYDWPAAIIMQRTAKDQWAVIEEYCGQSIDFGVFCKFVLEQVSILYDRKSTPEVHCIDPAGLQRYHQRAESGAISDAHEIMERWSRKKFGEGRGKIRPGAVQVGTRDNEGPRIKEVRKLMILRDDHKYSLIINKHCTTVKIGFETGYVRDKYGKPVKNKYSHPMDAIQYGVTAFQRMVNPDFEKKKKKKVARSRIGHRTGM